MRWQLGRRSQNVEDRRGAGGMCIPAGFAFRAAWVGVVWRGGIGGVGLIVLLLVAWFLGTDLLQGSGPVDAPCTKSQPPAPRSPRRSACGFAQSAMGPFYRPLDQKFYVDLSFYQDLHDRFQAPGDFAQAYVIAHEVGHRVQKSSGRRRAGAVGAAAGERGRIE